MEYKYDITLSFAGENREYVEKVAEILKQNNVKVFYDKFEESELWGKDLGIHFEFVYRRSAKYCILFISKYYKNKLWTNYEIKNAISRAIETKEDYILPARFDDTEIDGIRSSIGYIDLRKYKPEEFAEIILKKLKKDHQHKVLIHKELKSEEVAKIYLSQNLLITDLGIQGVALGVTITNLTKDYRYYAEPYFKLSYGIKGKYDTFFLTDRMENIYFPIKLEWGQPLSVNYKLSPAGVVQWKDLTKGTTIKAIVTSTIGEKFESNEIEIEKIIESLTNKN